MEHSVTIEIWDGSNWVPTVQVVDVSNLIIDEENLDSEACTLGQIMVEYGDIWARLRSQLSRKEEKLRRVDAGLALAFRGEGFKPNDKIKESVLTTSEHRRVFMECEATRVDTLKAESWWRTVQQKADLIKMLGYRKNTELKKM